jgi:hypothetical protein
MLQSKEVIRGLNNLPLPETCFGDECLILLLQNKTRESVSGPSFSLTEKDSPCHQDPWFNDLVVIAANAGNQDR